MLNNYCVVLIQPTCGETDLILSGCDELIETNSRPHPILQSLGNGVGAKGLHTERDNSTGLKHVFRHV